jgi:hypothetical protein
MKQLTTTKHIIFVILLLVIILSLFRGNIVEGYKTKSKTKSKSKCNSYYCQTNYLNSDDCNKTGTGCKWDNDCKCK